MSNTIDEAKLTAYALDELPAADRVAVEAYLADHADARTAVAEIRQTAAMLSGELARELAEPLPYQTMAISKPRWRSRLGWQITTTALAAAAAMVISAVIYESMLPPSVFTTVPGHGQYADKMLQTAAPVQPVPQMAVPPVEVAQANQTPKEIPGMFGRVGGMPNQSAAAWKSNSTLSADYPVASDLNPLAVRGANTQAATAAMHARHLEDGQNGLYGDGHAEFTNNPFSGTQRDNIYAARAAANNGSTPFSSVSSVAVNPTPFDTADSILSPGASGNPAAATTPRPDLSSKLDVAQSERTEFRDANGNIVPSTATGASRTLDWQSNVGNAAVPGSIAANPGNYQGSLATASSPNTTGLSYFHGNVAPATTGGYRVMEDGHAQYIPSSSETGPNTETYPRFADNGFLPALQNPLSTFSIDVDTASYANIRRFLNNNQLPPGDAVRVEEMVNYFPYDYAGPRPGDDSPVAVHVEVADCPWEPSHRLARVAIKAKMIAPHERPASNLVFLIDVSGSMGDPNKLDLLKKALPILVEHLTSDDHVSIVTYAGETGIALPRTNGANKAAILSAIDNLNANGSTNGGAGILLAYSTAVSGFIKGGVNRVILATDGDFNVGVTDPDELVKMIEKQATTGVYLSVLGMGMGNVKDATMEKLADHGHGNYAYIDSLEEANKVLSRQVDSTLITVAKDVKVQVEFNPAKVAGYRLVGYEDRAMAKEDFNNDQKAAGDMGAGHAVTALYEIVPNGVVMPAGVDPLKYQPAANAPATNPVANELMTVKIRYKQPDNETSQKLEVLMEDTGEAYAKASSDFRFASAVASLGMMLRNSPYKGNMTYDAIIEDAGAAKGEDVGGYRTEFVELVKKTKAIADP